MVRGSSSSAALSSAIRRCYFRIAGSVQTGRNVRPVPLARCAAVGVLLRDKCGQFVRLLLVEFVLSRLRVIPTFLTGSVQGSVIRFLDLQDVPEGR